MIVASTDVLVKTIVRKAAKKLKVGKVVLKTFINRAGIKTRIVFEVDKERATPYQDRRSV